MAEAPVPLDELLAHREWVRRLASALTRDEHDAEDVEQAAWLAAVRTPPVHRASLRGWLGTTLRRAAGRVRRSRAREEAATAALRDGSAADGTAEDVADLAARADLHRRVVEALVALDEPYRATLLLRFFEGLTVAEVAARTGVPLETCRARLRRGIETLRGRLASRREDVSGLALLAVPTGRGAGGPSGAGAAAGGLVMGTKAWAASAAVLLLVVGGVWWTTRGSGAPRNAASAPAAPAPDAPRAGTARAAAHPRATPPGATPPTAAAPKPVLPAPPPADLKSRLQAARMTIRWAGAGFEQGLSTIAAESGAEIVVPKAALERFATVQVNLTLEDVSAFAALRTVCKIVNADADVQADRVVVRPQGAAAADDGELVRVRRLDEFPQATVVFRVVDAGGVPLAGAEVLSDGGPFSFGTTDASGTVTARRTPPFPWALARFAGRIDSPAVRVPADVSAPSEVTLTLGGMSGRLRGTLRTEDGRPVARHLLRLAPVEGGRVRGPGHWLQTDDSGAFDDPSCPPGRIVLTAQAEGYASTQRECDVGVGEEVRIDVVLAREAVCAGLVRGVTGDPAPAVRVTASAPNRQGLAVVFTDPEGHYRVAGLPAGRITIDAVDLRTRAAARTEIDVGAGETRTWDPQLEPPAK